MEIRIESNHYSTLISTDLKNRGIICGGIADLADMYSVYSCFAQQACSRSRQTLVKQQFHRSI